MFYMRFNRPAGDVHRAITVHRLPAPARTLQQYVQSGDIANVSGYAGREREALFTFLIESVFQGCPVNVDSRHGGIQAYPVAPAPLLL